MPDSQTLRVVSLASGGLYGPFRDEAAARDWAEREFPVHVWNVLPMTWVDTPDSKLGVFPTRTFHREPMPEDRARDAR